METILTAEELKPLRMLPENVLIDMAADLDICVPEKFDAGDLVERCIPLIIERGIKEGLPLSKLDIEDLSTFSQADLDALGKLQGLKTPTTVAAVVRKGQRVYRWYRRNRPDNPVALMLPMLLPAVARAARRSPLLR